MIQCESILTLWPTCEQQAESRCVQLTMSGWPMHPQGTTFTKQSSLNYFHGPLGGWRGVWVGVWGLARGNTFSRQMSRANSDSPLQTALSHPDHALDQWCWNCKLTDFYIQTEAWLVQLHMTKYSYFTFWFNWVRLCMKRCFKIHMNQPSSLTCHIS